MEEYKNSREFNKYCKSGDKPDDIPNTPDGVYKYKGWNGWADFLGTSGKVDYNYLPYKKANEKIKKLNLKNNKDWKAYCDSGDKPVNIPKTPDQVYKNKGWKSWGEWLGTGVIADKNKVFREFEEAKIFVQGLNLNTQNDWKEYCKSGNKPSDIPASPHIVYKNKGWNGLPDFLGKESK